MRVSRAPAALAASLGCLFITLDVALAQTERTEMQWDVYAGNESSTFAPSGFEERGNGTRFAIQCDGNPAAYTLIILADLDPPPWGYDFEGTLLGSLRIGGGQDWQAPWRSANRAGIETELSELDVEALTSSAGALGIQIEVPGEGAFSHAFIPSDSIAPLVPDFLETCRHHVQTTDLQFQVDGIEVVLQIEVDAQDIEAIRELAREFGIDEIARIWIGFTGYSSLVAETRGRETQSRNELSRLTLELGNTRWQKSSVTQDDDSVLRAGWYTSSPYLHEFRRWIVTDGTRSLRVAVGRDVSYDVTKRIVGAIRDGGLVDGRVPNLNTRLFAMPSPWHLDSPDADGRPWIGRAQGEMAGDDACSLGCYDVRFLSGKTITVRLVDEIVEVVHIGLLMH